MIRSELLCVETFRKNGPYCHVATAHTVTEPLFRTSEMRKTVISLIGYYAKRDGIRILGYEVMLTHLHLLYAAPEEAALKHCEQVLAHYLNCGFAREIRARLTDLCPKAFRITELKQLRDELAYIIRNRFAVDPDANLFAKPAPPSR